MRFDVDFERILPHPVGAVWKALTDRRALSAWLNETADFEPVVGKGFQMRCTDESGHEDVYLCRVLELEPRRFMAWSWQLQETEPREPTRVEFHLETVADGTRLRVRHSGDRDPAVIERFRSGWPAKLADLDHVLTGPGPTREEEES